MSSDAEEFDTSFTDSRATLSSSAEAFSQEPTFDLSFSCSSLEHSAHRLEVFDADHPLSPLASPGSAAVAPDSPDASTSPRAQELKRPAAVGEFSPSVAPPNPKAVREGDGNCCACCGTSSIPSTGRGTFSWLEGDLAWRLVAVIAAGEWLPRIHCGSVRLCKTCKQVPSAELRKASHPSPHVPASYLE